MTHEIATVLIGAQENMLVPEANQSNCQLPRAAGEMLAFASYDLDKRVEDLRNKLDLPTGAVLKVVGGRECA